MTTERKHDLPKVADKCCCGQTAGDGQHPIPCFACRAANDLCECCGAPGDDCYPYGVYCEACWDDVGHPTGFGWCFVEGDGREHRCVRPADWKERLTPKERREMGLTD